MRRLKNTKRLISFVLAFVMVCSFIPITAIAAEFTAQTFSVVSWHNSVFSEADGTKYIHCQYDQNDGLEYGIFLPESESCIKLVKAGKTESDAVNIGNTDQSVFVNNTGGYCYIRYSQYWMNLLGVGDIGLPADGDYIIVEGSFTKSDSGNTITVPKTYIKLTASGDNLIASSTAEQPEELKDRPAAVQAGHMTEGQGSINANSCLFFTVTGSAIPAGNYKAVSESVIKIVRGNQEYDAAVQGRGEVLKSDGSSAYLDLGGLANEWFLSPYVVAGDILVVEGDFTDGTNTVHIDKSVIIIDENRTNVTFATSLPSPAIQAGHMTEGQGSINANSCLFFTVTGSAIPEGSYKAASESVIKIVRGEQEYNAAVQGRGTVLQSSSSGTYLELGVNGSEWYMSPAAQAGDILVVEGDFTDGTNTVHIDQSVIIIDENRANVTFATEIPTEPDIIEAGTMKVDSDHTALNNGGFYFTMDANELPYTDDWNTRYSPVNASVIKLVRGGATINAGIAERAILVKYGANAYYLDTGNGWFMNGAPLAAGDMLIVEGQFTNGTVTFNVSKSYIKVWDDGSLTISTTEPTEKPTQNVIEVGSLVKDSDNSSRKDSANGTGIYFTLPENEIPLNDADPWANRFMAFNADCIKLIRDGKTTSIGNTAAGTIVKYDATHYYIDLAKWAYQDAPLTDDDILLIGGKFADGGFVFNITPTYISFSEGFVFFSTEYPEQKPEVEVLQVGHLVKDAERNARMELDDGSIGIYFTLPQNNIPYASDWSVRYNPASADSIKLIRDGKTTSIGNTDAGTIVKYDATHYYIVLDKWAYKDVPITADDILVIEGRFSGGDTIFEVSKTYISFSHGMVIFSDEYPTGDESGITVVKTGNMSNDERGRQDNVIYFRMDTNSAPYKSDWSLRYSPVSADCVKLVRGGVTYNIGNPGHGTIIKFSATEYAIETSTWTMGNVVPIREGDVLIIEGEFVNTENSTVLNFSRNYIGIYYGMPFFSTSYPSGPNLDIVEVGVFSQDTRPMTKDGIYFNLPKNAAAYKEDWSLRYSPIEAANVKLIRNGKTYEIGLPNHGTIVKFSETEYYIETTTWTMGNVLPLKQGDVLVLNGKFISSNAESLLELDNIYIFFNKAKRNLKPVFTQPVDSMEASFGENIQLTAKDFAPGSVVTWSSSNNERATVDENGNVTILSNRGTVYITATVDGSGYSWQIDLYDNTEFGKVYFSNTDEEIITAVWCDSFHEFDEATLTRLEEAGVNLLIGVNAKQVGKSGMKYLLDRAKKHGIGVIADLRDWDGEKMPIYCKHSNLKGFLMWDEPTADDIEALAELKAKFDDRLPDNLSFYVTMGDQAYDIDLLYKLGQLTLKQNPFSGDNILSDYFGTLDALASKALKQDVSWNSIIPNADSLTAEQLRWLVSVAQTYGVKGLTNYTYMQTASDEEAEALYGTMKDSNGKTISWDDIYMSYSWLGISKVDAGKTNLMFEKLTNDVPADKYGVLSDINSDQDLLIGSFENEDGQYAYMITNAGNADAAQGDDTTATLSMENASVTVQLKDGQYRCVAVIRNGEISYVAVSADNTFTVDIAANEGVFVIPVV